MSEFTRVFSGSKTVDSRVLNRVGAQPFRAVLARLIYNLRTSPHSPQVAELSRTGLLVCDDFLPPDAFAATVREADEFIGATVPRWLHQHGTTVVRQFLLNGVDAQRFPNLEQWRNQDQAISLVSAAERRPLRGPMGDPLVEDISVGDYSEPDPQTRLHADTVFNTHKIWLYLTDVDVRSGPLVYVRGSHHLDRARLHEEYLDSTSTSPCLEPSRRISDDEVRRRGLERLVLTCPRNTLVIANTCGYHCRSEGEPGASRRALHMSFRFNPFRYPMPRTSRFVHGAATRVRSAASPSA